MLLLCGANLRIDSNLLIPFQGADHKSHSDQNWLLSKKLIFKTAVCWFKLLPHFLNIYIGQWDLASSLNLIWQRPLLVLGKKIHQNFFILFFLFWLWLSLCSQSWTKQKPNSFFLIFMSWWMSLHCLHRKFITLEWLFVIFFSWPLQQNTSK